jgi:hypothetical protein
MHELRENSRFLNVDAVCDCAPCLGLFGVCHAGLEGVALGEALVGVDAFGDDHAEPAFGEAFVVADHRVGRDAGLRGADASHGGHRQAVAQGEVLDIERR